MASTKRFETGSERETLQPARGGVKAGDESCFACLEKAPSRRAVRASGSTPAALRTEFGVACQRIPAAGTWGRRDRQATLLAKAGPGGVGRPALRTNRRGCSAGRSRGLTPSRGISAPSMMSSAVVTTAVAAIAAPVGHAANQLFEETHAASVSIFNKTAGTSHDRRGANRRISGTRYLLRRDQRESRRSRLPLWRGLPGRHIDPFGH